MHSVQLRGYTEADLSLLHALDQLCFPPGIAYSRAELRSFLHHPSSFTAIAFVGSAVHGFAIVRPVRRKLHQEASKLAVPVLHVLTIDVAPEARRQGVGGMLMQWIFGKASELRVQAIALEVAVDNYTAQRFYASLGFTVTGRIPGYYNGVTDAFELERAIAQTSILAECEPASELFNTSTPKCASSTSKAAQVWMKLRR